MRNKGATLFDVLFVVILVVMIIAACLQGGGCTDPEGTKRVLEDQGYTNIRITGYRLWIKGEDDTYSTGFEATSPSGHVVTGAVTSAWGKGKTIRMD